MTITQLAEALRPVIKEVVTEAIQAELREILTEAVEIASRPEDSDVVEAVPNPVVEQRRHLRFEKPDWVQELDAREQKNIAEGRGPTTQAGYDAQTAQIWKLLGDTAKGMSSEDKRNFGS